ncbi:iron ABC transporter permease [Vallicoccus soli]|uniref:Iron ABC transporter permease n=1 Tax=Vallicoccus soli TaxID=2339232 RepID=A0A3A3Z3C0_9ACTN|nr:iron ABC transporter permease [Vallicoccus soli]
MPHRRAVRLGPVSGTWTPRGVLVPLVLAALCALLVALGVARGDLALPLGDVLRILAGGGEGAERFVVVDLRLPRALTGLLVGASFGLAGALTQTITRNPLASPDLLGITAGAGAAAVALIVLGGGAAGGALAYVGLPLSALLGGLLTGVAVYALAWRGGIDGFRFVLVGIGFSAALGSVTSWLLLRAEITDAGRAQVWLTGSLNARGWEHVLPALVALVVVGGAVLVAAFALRALALGDDSARGLGVRLQLGQGALLLAGVVLAAVATACAGPIAFVALCAPQIALRLVRSPGPPLLASALVGAAIVLGGDLVARTLLPVELPVGIVTAALGAPYLLHLLVRRTREASA